VPTLEIPDSRFADIDGPVHYREWPGPEGLTFVCVHGLGGSILNWLSVAPGLAEHGRVVAVDLVGFGKTPRSGRSAGVRANRLVLSRFMRSETEGPVVLIGNSMGGAIAMLQAALEPDSVAALALTSPALPLTRSGRPDPVVVAAFALYQLPVVGERVMRRRAMRLGPERLVRETLALCCVDSELVDPAVVELMIEASRERQEVRDSIPAFLEAARSLLALSRRDRFGRDVMDRIRCPVLLMHGDSDRLVRVQTAIAAAEAHPAWRLRVLEGVGHVAQLEAPDRWLAEVKGWLRGMDANELRPPVSRPAPDPAERS
jgi:pimeloyl-ACP methyl ester carboxylesterase